MSLTRIPSNMLRGVGARLSVSSEPYPETDIASSTLYYGDLTLDISSAEAGKNYDVFLTPLHTLVAGPAWLNSTTRDLQVTAVGDKIVNAGPIGAIATGTAELIGGFRAHAAGQTRSTLQSRLVWSLYSPTLLPVSRIDTTDSWSYSASAWRQANGSVANQIEVMNGVSGRMVDVTATAYMINGTGTVVSGYTGIGIDSSAADSAQIKRPGAAGNVFPVLPPMATYVGFLGLGYHELRWLERGSGGSQTWYGDGGQPFGYQTGISGLVVV